MDDKIKYWIELSDYDLETAWAMYQSKRYLYVGFMCHQSIEKIFKAYYSKQKQATAPYTHSLSFIAEKGNFLDEFSESQREFIDMIEPLNIEARYPSYKEKLLKSLNEAKCLELFNTTKELQQWIRRRL